MACAAWAGLMSSRCSQTSSARCLVCRRRNTAVKAVQASLSSSEVSALSYHTLQIMARLAARAACVSSPCIPQASRECMQLAWRAAAGWRGRRRRFWERLITAAILRLGKSRMLHIPGICGRHEQIEKHLPPCLSVAHAALVWQTRLNGAAPASHERAGKLDEIVHSS